MKAYRPAYDDIEVLGTIPLSQSSEIVFSVTAYKGVYYANIRKFVETDRYSGPTKSGITLRYDTLNSLIELLAKFLQSMPELPDEEIGRISKSQSSTLIVRLIYPEGNDAVCSIDIREHITRDTYEGWSKKGIRIKLDQLRPALQVMQTAAKHLEAKRDAPLPLFEETSVESHGKQGKSERPETILQITEPKDGVIKDVMPDGPKVFPDDFLEDGNRNSTSTEIQLPSDPLRLGPYSNGIQPVISKRKILWRLGTYCMLIFGAIRSFGYRASPLIFSKPLRSMKPMLGMSESCF